MPIWKDYRLLTIAADFRVIYGSCAAKKIARDFGVAIVTATLWLSGQVPASRRRQIAAGLIVELDRQDALRAEVRRRLREIVENETSGSRTEMLGARSRARARMGRPETD